ncbi:HAMP domain-containing sensor histidine kinase [Clostridium estertheticum]|uniref:HAMP domain-containing sensor histidine kinase n=1 Tax=Clostridium estertheticum TaxID=238834 RepID=UPI001C7D4FC7|nr:HAMP domain-containing sensor histidine kinase [Clostridium estertheticum]MBX4270260.1 HAMP domain-containing histidine kinase [Clostridium estertheticum]WLC79762.1 HAMP domain-containing histidine kinase [Clostridium estertheticum]
MKKISMKFETRSLKWQLLFRWSLILTLLLIIMGISQYFITRSYLLSGKNQVLEARLHDLDKDDLQDSKSLNNPKSKAEFLVKLISDRNTSVVIIDKKGEIISESKGINDDTVPPHLSKEEYRKLILESGKGENYKIVRNLSDDTDMIKFKKINLLSRTLGLVQISTTLDPINTMLLNQIYFYIVASIIIIILGVLIGKSVLKYTLKPLYNLTNSLESVTVGELNMRLPIDNGQIEIDGLSCAFNGMFNRIETSFENEQYIKEKMQRFISDASHEIRTPLTSIHGFVEVLLRGAAKNEKQLDLALNSILTESERLTKLVNELLMLTKLDQQIKYDMKNENIKDIIEEIHPQLKILAGERRIDLELKDNLLVKSNRNQMKQIIYNLVQNAIQHTDEKDGIISISLNSIDKHSESFIVLKIKDNGSGIPEKDLNEIFDRFFRSDNHRSRKSGGYGLGLSIVKSIVDAHQGEINVCSELNKGTSFSIFIRKVE